MIFKLEKPDTDTISPNRLAELVSMYFDGKTNLAAHVTKTMSPEYLYWDKVKYRPIPDGLTKEEFWKLVKFFRQTRLTETEIQDEKTGRKFSWTKPHNFEEFVHNVDLNTGGNLFSFVKNIDETNRNKFISRGVMEEAIASSQLEGAHTTRKAAKKLLREGRKPKNESEQMILNNFNTMNLVESTYKHQKLSKDLMFELHAMITNDTVSAEEQGRFRNDDEEIAVVDKEDGTIYHIPPKRAFLETEIDRLVHFANDEGENSFTHPVVKAILLHFWIGYLHPFTDGNGRLARLLFYWYLLKHNYWAFAYLPISRIIKKSPVQYGNAYTYSEQDDLDLTYFIEYNIRKIQQAIKDFEEYLQEKAKENSQMNKATKAKFHLNDRQIQVLQFLHANSEESTNLKIHMNINQISKATAIKDLKELEKAGFIKSEKVKRNLYYFGDTKIETLF
jgi:Fic family protein